MSGYTCRSIGCNLFSSGNCEPSCAPDDKTQLILNFVVTFFLNYPQFAIFFPVSIHKICRRKPIVDLYIGFKSPNKEYKYNV